MGKEKVDFEKIESIYNEIIEGIRFITVQDSKGKSKVLKVFLPTMSQKLEAASYYSRRVIELIEEEGMKPEFKLRRELEEKGIWTIAEESRLDELENKVQDCLEDMDRLKKACKVEDIDQFVRDYSNLIAETKEGSAAHLNRRSLRSSILDFNKILIEKTNLDNAKSGYFSGCAEERARLEKDLIIMTMTIKDEEGKEYYDQERLLSIPVQELDEMRKLWIQATRGIRKIWD